MSCVFNKTGILVDGVLNDDNLNNYLNEIYDDDEIINFVDDVIHKCNEKRENHVMKGPKHKRGPFMCPYNNNNEGMLAFCTFIHTSKQCPGSAWSDTDECNAAREHFNQCKPPHHGPIEDDLAVEEDKLDEEQIDEEI